MIRYSITNSMDMNLSKLLEIAENEEPGVLQSLGFQRVEHGLATEQQQQIYRYSYLYVDMGIDSGFQTKNLQY